MYVYLASDRGDVALGGYLLENTMDQDVKKTFADMVTNVLRIARLPVCGLEHSKEQLADQFAILGSRSSVLGDV